MPIESPVLSKASVALWALERFLSCVMADMSHQRAFLPEASQAELTHIRFLIPMSPLMHLQGILSKTKTSVRHCYWNASYLSVQHNTKINIYKNHLGFVSLVASGTVVGPFIRVGPHVLTYMPDGSVQLATLPTLVPPLTDMDFHVFLQQVTSQKLLVAQCALKGLVACIKRKDTQRKMKYSSNKKVH